MISKNRIKFIHSLELKKNRKETNLFVAEGPKIVGELLPVLSCNTLLATSSWLSSHSDLCAHLSSDVIFTVTSDELVRTSFLKHPQEVLAVFEQSANETQPDIIAQELCLALDCVQDPGNLGTIIRIADWFGIEHIFCSLDTVDLYNPKTVQATMGAISRIKIYYTDLKSTLERLPENTPIYGTFLEGENIYKIDLEQRGLIIMGNEGKGISPEIAGLINKKLFIPNYPEGRNTSESLNVAFATAITCAEFRRRS